MPTDTSRWVPIIFIAQIFWPLPLMMLSALGITLGTSGLTFFSSVSIALVMVHFLSAFTFGRLPVLRSRFFYTYVLAYLLFCSITLSSIAGQLEIIEALAAYKTIGQLGIFIIWASFAIGSQELREQIRIADWYFGLCLIPIASIPVETIMKIVAPGLLSVIHSLAESAQFAGTSYLAYGDIDYWLLQGTRPLGFYFDMMTAQTIAFMASIYFCWRRRWGAFFFCMISTILSFRLTLVLSLFPICLLVYSGKHYKPVALAMLIAGISFSAMVLDFLSQAASPSILFGQLQSHLSIIADRSLIFNLVGAGYARSETSVVGYSEVFVYRYFEFFGILGALIMIILIAGLVVQSGVLTKGPHKKRQHANDWIETGSLSLGLAISILPMLVHYNLFFIGPVMVQFAIMFVLIGSSKRQLGKPFGLDNFRAGSCNPTWN